MGEEENPAHHEALDNIVAKQKKGLTMTPLKKICSKCGSGQVYVRIKEGSYVCRRCGNIGEINNNG